LKSNHEVIRIVHYIKLLKFLVDEALKVAELGYIYFEVVEFAWQAFLTLRALRA